MNEHPYATGAEQSPYDIRTFAFVPLGIKQKGGERYKPEDIEDQHRVGICTAISLTQNARKALGVRFSADFQYLCQKKYYDKNWDEGSSILSAMKVAKNIGFLPDNAFQKYVTEKDRNLPYHQYILKLQAISDRDIERLKKIAAVYHIEAYAQIPVDRDLLAQAIAESKAGIIARFAVGKAWWTPPVEPLRPSEIVVSGHAVTESNYDGGSFRVANTWGTEWAAKGTAYHLLYQYAPTEAWAVYYLGVPAHVALQLESRENAHGKLLDAVQGIIHFIKKFL